MRWTALVGIVVVGCATERGEDGPEVVTGCDDPEVWTATPLEEAKLSALVGGMPCSPAQYPLHRVELGWWTERLVSTAEKLRLDRTCWRVVDASEGSGASAGEELSATGYDARASVLLRGSGARLTVEGRVLRDDGTVAIRIPAEAIALRDVTTLDDDASATIAVMSSTAWAERDAVHLSGTRIATDEVLGASTVQLSPETGIPVTLHRTADGIVWRTWPLEANRPPVDVDLGTGTRARIAQFGHAVVIDDELVLLDGHAAAPQVRHRIPLDAEPQEIVGTYAGVVLHIGDELVRYAYDSTTPHRVAVPDGLLLPAMTTELGVYFDGTAFRRITRVDAAFFEDDVATFTPSPADLAAIGTPVAVLDGVVFGERGLLAIVEAGTPVHGPHVSTFAELFGGGTLGPLAPEGAAYVIRQPGGSAVLHGAYVANYCPI